MQTVRRQPSFSFPPSFPKQHRQSHDLQNKGSEALTGLHQETGKRKHILPHQHPAPVPDQLARAAPVDGEEERPRLVSDAQRDVDHQRGAEERDEGAVRSERGPVLVHAHVGRAVLGAGRHGAVLVRAIADEAVGVVVRVRHGGGSWCLI